MTLQQAQNKSRRFIEAAIGADSPTASGTYTNRILNEYKTALKGMERELEGIYAKFLTGVKPEDYYNEIIKFNRLSKMQAEIRTIYNAGARAAGRGIIEASKFSITTNYYANQYAVNWFSGLEGNTYFTAIPQAAVNVSVFGTPDAWAELTKIQRAKYRNLVPPSGTLTETLLKNRVADIERINTSITQGLVNGWGYRRTAANLQAAMDTTASNALRIIRTETHRNQMAGAYLNSIEAREMGIDIRRIWNATGNNTRDAHAELDGQEEDKNGMFEVEGEMAAFPGSFGVAALDINCACYITDNVGGVPPTATAGINPVTGQREIMNFDSMPEWAKENGVNVASIA